MKDYWKKFDLLCSELKSKGKNKMVNELREAQSKVNGLTDGWYDFLKSFEKTVKAQKLDDQTHQQAEALIETLKNQLQNK